MKAIKTTFSIFAGLAAVAIAAGAYWHIMTLAISCAMIYAAKNERI